jgi:hypothetical protein
MLQKTTPWGVAVDQNQLAFVPGCDVIAQKVFPKLFGESQFPNKSANLFIILASVHKVIF